MGASALIEGLMQLRQPYPQADALGLGRESPQLCRGSLPLSAPPFGQGAATGDHELSPRQGLRPV